MVSFVVVVFLWNREHIMSETVLKTPLYDRHVSAGATMGPEGNWSVPLHYGSAMDEALAVRNRAGLGDLSHLGRLRIRGDGAVDLLERLCTADVAHQEDNTALHTLLCNECGGILDECYIIRLENFWVLTTSPINRLKILAHLQAHAEDFSQVRVDDQTEKVAHLAVAGPDAQKLLDQALPISVAGLGPGEAKTGSLMIANYIALRGDYCGLFTLEVMLPGMFAGRAWEYITRKKSDEDTLAPAGMLARDILRIEAGHCRYGYEINETIDPISAGLMGCVELGQDFIGADAIGKLAGRTPARTRCGLVLETRARSVTPASVPKPGAEIRTSAGLAVGNITSATFSPSLAKIIAQGYLAPDQVSGPGELLVQLAGRSVSAGVSPMPFIA
jgi:aminomethyltransferase